MSRSPIFTTLVALCFLVPIGCAATASEDDAEAVAEAQDELSSVARVLVGKYYARTVSISGIARLTLESNGKYTAHIEASDRVRCFTSPCVLPESGTWNAFKTANGSLRLSLHPTRQMARFYEAREGNGQLDLTKDGKTQTLTELDADQCIDSADCGATEQCAVKVCALFCMRGSLYCCGPSRCEPKAPTPKRCGGFAALPCGSDEECVDDPTDGCDPREAADCGGICRPKAPPPPPSPCWGAWLDPNGVCRTPADGVYPAACCAAPKCGDAQCAAGEVCCNPLAGICTKPGELCAL
jgi:hypothetical protein